MEKLDRYSDAGTAGAVIVSKRIRANTARQAPIMNPVVDPKAICGGVIQNCTTG